MVTRGIPWDSLPQKRGHNNSREVELKDIKNSDETVVERNFIKDGEKIAKYVMSNRLIF